MGAYGVERIDGDEAEVPPVTWLSAARAAFGVRLPPKGQRPTMESVARLGTVYGFAGTRAGRSRSPRDKRQRFDVHRAIGRQGLLDCQ